MLKRIAASMLKIFSLLFLLIIACSVGFNIILSDNSSVENPATAIARGLTWFSGQTDFFSRLTNRTHINKAPHHFYGAHAYYIIFLFCFGIVGLNFLTTVAIGETKEISLQSRKYSYKSIADLIHYLEGITKHFLFSKLPKKCKGRQKKQSESRLILLSLKIKEIV